MSPSEVLPPNWPTAPLQGLSVDFTFSPPLVGASFTIAPPTTLLDSAVASDGTSGSSLVVQTSTTSEGRSPRAYYELPSVP